MAAAAPDRAPARDPGRSLGVVPLRTPIPAGVSFLVASRSRPGAYRTVNPRQNTCSCPATRECWHLKTVREILQLREQLRLHAAAVVRCECRGQLQGHQYTCKPTWEDLARDRLAELERGVRSRHR